MRHRGIGDHVLVDEVIGEAGLAQPEQAGEAVRIPAAVADEPAAERREPGHVVGIGLAGANGGQDPVAQGGRDTLVGVDGPGPSSLWALERARFFWGPKPGHVAVS